MMENTAAKGRFKLLGELGAGGMGIVYEALDRELGSVVALKTLRRLDATALYRFKQEFRALAELSHPNLVQLHELFADEDHWFFTMELIDGVDFLTHVLSEMPTDAGEEAAGRWPGAPANAEPSGTTEETVDIAPPRSVPVAPGIAVEAEPPPRGDPPGVAGDGGQDDPGLGEPTGAWSGPQRVAATRTQVRPAKVLDDGRLRPAMLQLAEGVHALHRAGKLHRDIKPSNILVRPDGRVVLLDFGLVLDLGEEGPAPGGSAPASPVSRWSPGDSGSDHATEAGLIVGTAAYMAPEQAAGEPLTEACDWYSVGVVLYRALTGRLPFEGSIPDVLTLKRRSDLKPPAELRPGIAADLNALCVDLLRRDPAARPTGAEVLARLRSGTGEGRPPDPKPATTDAMPFVGRDHHLKALESAYAEMILGRAVAALIRGSSGVGKSSMIRRFLDRIAVDRRVLLLFGRCFEQESVPYKGLDSLVDELSRALLRMPRADVEGLLPRSTAGLARLFPVLLRVDAVAAASERSQAIPEPQELRRSGFAALRELLTQLGTRQPLVLVLDDLQWGDEDSAALLLDLLRPPDPPRFLLLASYRSEYHDSSACIRALRASAGNRDASQSWHELTIGPLEPREARTLALRILGEGGPEAEARADWIARESQGIPYFVGELTRQVQAGDGPFPSPAASREIRLEDVLWRRVEGLAPETRHLLEIVSTATRPIRLRDACEASGLGTLGPQAVSTLRAARLLRRSGPGLDDEVEVFHDRIRETIVGRVPGEVLRAHHDRLAVVLGKGGRADAETLAVHYHGAERFAEAGEAYARAAEQAAEALAFDRAAKLYRASLDLRTVGVEEGYRLRLRLAEALANAGRGTDAAREFLAAAALATPEETPEMERRAAYQYCISGRVDEGLATFRRVMSRVGLRLPRSPGSALFSLLMGRLRLGLRGLSYTERRVEEIAPEEIARIDVTWSASAGLTVVDTIGAADLQTRNLLLALRVGEPARLARALAWEAAHAGVAGERARSRSDRLLYSAREIAMRLGSPYLDGLILLASGAGAYFRGEFPAARELIVQAERLFRGRCTGVAWELGTAHSFHVWSLYWLGEFGELARLVPNLVQEARARDDLYLETNLCGWASTLGWLSRHEPAAARQALAGAMGHWTHTSFHSQHMLAMGAEVQIHLYNGDGPAAWNAAAVAGPAMRRSGLLRVQLVRAMYYSLRAQAALAAAGASADPGSFLASAGRDARRLLREDARWLAALGKLIHAAVRFARGENVAAALEEVTHEFEAFGMRGYAAAARYRLGELIGGDRGRELKGQALGQLSAQQVVEPERIIGVFAPEFVGRASPPRSPVTDRGALT